tara:strand:- start:23302 stop:24384 length:1083 start_codon:yes stop_codon:yes gene_type:complete
MKSTIRQKLETITDRFSEITALLAEPEIQAKTDNFRELGKEYAQLEPIVKIYQEYSAYEVELSNAKELVSDKEMAELAENTIEEVTEKLQTLLPQLNSLLLPKDPNDGKNIFLEIRAGTGGAEAALFAGDLLKMYLRFAELQNWESQIISQSQSEFGGFKEVIARIKGRGVFSHFKFESGAHRVQRVPETESQGRVHTSACTVAVMPEPDSVEEIDISSSDLRIDTFRASGAGGQHVNKTDSAIRITHIPSGLVVECQEERSQHKNKARALSLLSSRLKSLAEKKAQKDQAEERKLQVGSGDRSERIRTYNFPQNRLTDHRINLTIYKLEEVMMGSIDQVIEPLMQEYQAEQLTLLSKEL